uniref:Uncharacterized protein n=1 Tax=Arundo donax TaxID=35708 RepID=A0A0A9G1D3_ARUDO
MSKVHCFYSDVELLLDYMFHLITEILPSIIMCVLVACSFRETTKSAVVKYG